MHVTVEHDGSWLTGVPDGRFEHVVEGRGRVVGAALRPGGLRWWSPLPAHELTGRSVPLDEVLDTVALASAVSGARTPTDAAGALLAVLARTTRGPAGEQASLVRTDGGRSWRPRWATPTSPTSSATSGPAWG